VLDEIGTKVGGRVVERDGPFALRALARGAKDVAAAVGGGPRAYLELVARVLRAPVQAAPASPIVTAEPGTSGLILPPD
jgi:hypothetical protein